MIDKIQVFLDDIATYSPPDFKSRALGIAEWYEQHGILSSKQRQFVRVASSNQKKPCPIEFENMAESEREREAIAATRNVFKETSFEDEIKQIKEAYTLLVLDTLTDVQQGINGVFAEIRKKFVD